MTSLSPDLLRALVDRLTLALFVFHRRRVVYLNAAAKKLIQRLRATYRIELEVMLRDHLDAVLERSIRSTGHADDSGSSPIVTLLTATTGEPLYVHVMRLARGSAVGVSVRGVGGEIDAIQRRYGLSEREAQVAELVLHGYKNVDIAATLGITLGTTKKHLTRIFDKVGVNTRSQLQMRLA